jgi:glycosyltransferase involved in cell wall biosynthesis
VTETNQLASFNVLFLAEDFYPKKSGGAFIDWNVARNLVDSGDQVTVVTPRNDQTPKSETVRKVEIRRPFSGPGPGTHPNSGKGIFRRLIFMISIIPYLIYSCYEQDFDIIYSTNYICHLPATIISTIFWLPHVSFVGYSPSIQDEVSLRDPLVLLERINFRLFMGDQVLCQTPAVRETISNVSEVDVTRVDGIVDREAVEAVIEADKSLNISDNMDGTIQLVFVGRLVEIKNVSKLPHLIARLSSSYSLLIVGDGPERSNIQTAIEQAGVEARVRLTGQLSHTEALQTIYESDVLLLPSKSESYGAVVFEALSLNTSVLATPVGILPEIEHPNLTIAPFEDFDEAINRLNVNTQAGVDENAIQRFSVDTFANEVREHLELAKSSKQGGDIQSFFRS